MTEKMKQMSTNHPKPEASDKLLMALENHELSFNSTTLKELCKELQDDNKNIIGLYGQQGSGKTTLVEAVRDKAQSLKIFDAVLFGTVSPNPVIGVIRYQSAEWSNLKVGGYRSRTALNSQKLGSMNRILVILDDVPAKFDPEKKIGINPCSDRRWKFLLTTRREQECTLMIGKTEIPCETMIPMRPLSDEDSWTLLQEHLGIEDDDKSPSNLQLLDVAKKVALACNKLPGTIMQLCRYSKNKSIVKWTKLLDSLSPSTTRYQIFLSFTGSDTGNTFSYPLYEELENNGFKTFMDSYDFSDNTIEDSKLSIIVLSQNYLGSDQCLDQLVNILNCMKTKYQPVWSIFYNVEPNHVKHQAKGVGIAMAKLEEKFKRNPNKIKKWKSALSEVATLPGWCYTTRMSPSKIIQEILDAAVQVKYDFYIFRIYEYPLSDGEVVEEGSDMEEEEEESGTQEEEENQEEEEEESDIQEEEEDHDMVEEIELSNANRRKIEPISSRNFVCSKSQVQSSRSNLQPPSSKSTSSNKKAPNNQFLKALEGDDELLFNSTTLKELSTKLQDDSINKIGLHGKQGSGKTTLVKAVRDKAKSLKKIFDAVLFVTVSQNSDDWNIQNQIAESLNLKFGSKGQVGRAMEINSALGCMNRILVILDDAPMKFDPEKCIGISCNDQRCKFLLTTRSKHYFFGLGNEEIRCQNMISMRSLSPEDAWRLLQQHSGVDDDDDDDDEASSNLLTVAREIAFKYKWLPGLIKKLGSSLKDKPLEEWEGLLDSLRHSSACYQIFLSFRGEDTRDHFTTTLYAELKRNRFETFMDDKLKHGDQISIKLIKAIENSRLSIIVLSKNYADSAWCLDELVHILKCKETKKQLVWPIFYEVEPTDIRHQKNDVGKAMAKLENKFEKYPDKIKNWKNALFDVCQLTGRTYTQGISQHQFIQEIIKSANESKNYLYIRSMDMD